MNCWSMGKHFDRLLYFYILNVLFCRSSGYEEKSSVQMEVENSQKKAPIGTIFWCAKINRLIMDE